MPWEPFSQQAPKQASLFHFVYPREETGFWNRRNAGRNRVTSWGKGWASQRSQRSACVTRAMEDNYRQRQGEVWEVCVHSLYSPPSSEGGTKKDRKRGSALALTPLLFQQLPWLPCCQVEILLYPGTGLSAMMSQNSSELAESWRLREAMMSPKAEVKGRAPCKTRM